MSIHSTAQVSPDAQIGENVMIGPYCVVEGNAAIGDGCELQSHVVIKKEVKLGENCKVHPFAVIGDDPQYVGFDTNLKTGVIVGAGTTLREGVTIHRSIYEEKNTIIGEQNYLMAYSHVAHDCVLDENVILTNATLLAGHIEVAKNVYIGGNAAIHQYVRIGEGAMVAGMAAITMDAAPYLMVAERDEVSGLNLVGLKRRGVSRDAIKELKACYQSLFKQVGNVRKQAAALLEEGACCESEEAKTFLRFFEGGKRGFAGVRLKGE